MRCQLLKEQISQNMFSYSSKKSELRNFVEYFKKNSKNKMIDLVDVNMSSKVGQKKTEALNSKQQCYCNNVYITSSTES